MKLRYRSILLALAAAFVATCVCAPALAAGQSSKDSTKHNIADIWMFWPKHGQSSAFEQGLKQHVAWRKSAGDPFEWQVYQPVVGDDLGYYIVRSSNHAWGDMDSERDWGMKHDAGAQFRKDVGSHVRYDKHHFDAVSGKYSHWTNSKDYRYFAVTIYHFKSGHGAAVRNMLKKVHEAVTKQDWPYSYSIESVIGGDGGMAIVEPMKNWADMADPSPSLMDVMTKAMGSKKAAQKLFDSFSGAIKSRTYTVYVSRPDLSTQD